MCDKWQAVEKITLYNQHGEYVEGFGWAPVYIMPYLMSLGAKSVRA